MDPFDFLSKENKGDGAEGQKTSTIDDDFDALFGSFGGSDPDGLKGDEPDNGHTADDENALLEGTEQVTISSGQAASGGTDSEATPAMILVPDSVNDPVPSIASSTALDPGDNMGSLPSAIVIAPVTDEKGHDLFSFEDNDPGLDFFGSATNVSHSKGSRDDIFEPTTDDKKSLSKNKDSLDDIFGSTTDDKKSLSKNKDSLDDIFGTTTDDKKSLSKNKAKDPLDDIFGSTTDDKKSLSKNKDPLDDFFGSTPDDKKSLSKNKDPLDDFFGPTTDDKKSLSKNKDSLDNLFESTTDDKGSLSKSKDFAEDDIFGASSSATKTKGEQMVESDPLQSSAPAKNVTDGNDKEDFEEMFTSRSSAEIKSEVKDDLFAPDVKNDSSDFFVPSSSPPHSFPPEVEENVSGDWCMLNSNASDRLDPSRGGNSLFDIDSEEFDPFSPSSKSVRDSEQGDAPLKPDDLLQKDRASNVDLFADLPDSSSNSFDPFDKRPPVSDVLTPSSHVKGDDLMEQTGEVTVGEKVRGPDILDFLEDLGPSQPEPSTVEDSIETASHPDKPKETDDHLDKSQSALTTDDPNEVKFLLTSPSLDAESVTVGSSGRESKKENNDHKDSEMNNDRTSLDFSVLSIPESTQLNVDVNKHKRSLTKKGSLAMRKRPTRRAIRSSGSEAEDALFQDSTDPKPSVADEDDDDDDDNTKNHQRPEVFESGDQRSASPSEKEKGRPKGLIGGIKIPGLLEGLKKAKPFTKNTASSDIKVAEKEDTKLVTKTVTASQHSSKSLKDSQNQSIAQKPSELKKPMAGSIKLPALKPIPSSEKNAKPPAKIPPPVASKPSLPGKPKLSPIDNQKTKGSNLKTDFDRVDSSKPAASEKPVVSTPTPPVMKTTSSTPIVPISTRPKPFTPPKPKPYTPPKPNSVTPRPALKPMTKPRSGTDKPNDTDSNGKQSDGGKDNAFLETSSDWSENIEAEKDMSDGEPLTRRKSSVSGVTSVQFPSGPDKSAPRKSSISGSAYAPMGFKSALERSLSSEGSDKSRTNSLSSSDGLTNPKSRTSSILETSEVDKDENVFKADVSRPEKVEETTTALKKDTDTDVEKKADISHKDKKTGQNGADGEKPRTAQKPAWGVQLRKVERKTPVKPPADQNKDVQSPSNWRQQLANKRNSTTPKEPAVKGSESDTPEWVKSSVERRKRLVDSGVIKSDPK